MTYFVLKNPSGVVCAAQETPLQCPTGWTVDEVDGDFPPAETSIDAVKKEAARRILDRYPQWKQVNAALGLYAAAFVATMTAYINAVRAASDAIEARLAADPYLDPATQPEWPL